MKRNLLKTILALLCILVMTAPLISASADLSQMGIFDYAVVSGTNSLNLRDGPGTEYNLLGSAPEGAWVGLRGESGNWYSVVLPETGQMGYMSKNFLKRSDGAPSSGTTTGVVNNPVASQFLNLRQYPSYSAPVLGIFYNGAPFTLLSSTGDGWYQVQISGQVGYFRQEYVRLNGSAGGSVAYISTANGGKLNLRNAPTYTGSSILGQYANGSQVSVLLKGAKQNGAAFWKISIQGVVGYVDSSFLTASVPYAPSVPSTPSTPTYPSYPGSQPPPSTSGYGIVNNAKATQVLNLRAQPSTSAKVIAQYKNGIRLEVIQPGATWCKVYGKASGNIGYVMTKYLRLYGVSATPTKTVQNGNSYVNLRSAPSKQSGAIYQRVYSGAQVTVLTPGDEWTQVRYGSTTGYMMTCFLK